MKEIEFSKILQAELIKQAEKEFGSTARLNEEKVKKLLNSKIFFRDVDFIRNQFNIPKLGSNDVRNIYLPKEIISESIWLEENIRNDVRKCKEYQRLINWITERYQLPFNFMDWLENFILYRESFGIPKYPIATGAELLLSESLPSKIRLTTQEKRHFIADFRKLLKLPKTGRIPKELQKVYRKFVSYLNRPKSKNKNRKQKNLDIGIKVFNKHKSTEMVHTDGQHEREYKLGYLDLAGKLFPNEEDISLEADTKRAQRLRKINQRHKEQVEFKNK